MGDLGGVLGVFGVLSYRQANRHLLLVLLGFLLLSRRFGPPFVYSRFRLSAWLLLVCVSLCVGIDQRNGLLCSVRAAFLERGFS